jgi:uncharacterized protein
MPSTQAAALAETSPPEIASAQGPLAVTERSLAPDLARGFMLLPIVLAHAPAFINDRGLGPVGLNRVAEFIQYLVVENQSRAMFIFLFGYGLGQLTQHQVARGSDWKSLRGLLLRRGFWLLAIGFVHTALLVPLDIIAIYGMALLMLAPLVRAKDKTLLWTAAVTIVPATLLIAWQGVAAHTAAVAGTPVSLAAIMAANPLDQALVNLQWWPIKPLVSVIVVVPGMLLGVWAARRQVLDRPEQHTILLRRVAMLFVGAALVGRLPEALLMSGVWSTTSAPLIWTVSILHTLTGYAGGIGMAAVVGLVAIRIGTRRGPVTTALVALGQRSLTFYLLQSAVLVTLFYCYTLNLHGQMGIAATYAVAISIWIASVLLAELMRRTGRRGPAEVLLRRLSYPKAVKADPAT